MEKPPASRRSRIFLVVGTLVVLALLAVFIFVVRPNWDQPLAPGLDLPTVTAPAPSATLPPDEPTPLPEPTAEPAANPVPQPVCGGPESMIIVAIGSDSRAENAADAYLYGQADVIRIARVDFVNPRVQVMSFPRDLWVEIPEIVEERGGMTHGKLNASYTWGNPGLGWYSGPGAGAGLLARTLDLNFGLRADHYVAVSMEVFVNMVDAIGGLDLYLDAPVDGSPRDGGSDFGYYRAGWHHMDGETALKFSRIRKVDTVFHRMDRQNQVLCAFRQQMMTPAVVGEIPKLILDFRQQVLTDLSLSQMSQLACLALRLDGDDIILSGLPRELFSATSVEGTFVWGADYDVIRGYVADFMVGDWPLEDSGSSCVSTTGP